MKRIAVLALVLFLAGCVPIGPQAGGPVPQGPTQPPTPAGVYKPVDPASLRFDPADLDEAATVSYVTMRSNGKQAGLAGPLWGDVAEDRPKIAHILRLIRLAKKADPPLGTREGQPPHDTTWVVIHYADGHEVRVGHAWKRLDTGAFQTIPDRMYMDGVGEFAAREFDEWYRGVAPVGRRSLLPPLSPFTFAPRQVAPGGTVAVRGEGWVEGARASIYFYDSGAETRRHLGEAVIDRGQFTWSGPVPADVEPGVRWRHALELEVDGTQADRVPIEVK